MDCHLFRRLCDELVPVLMGCRMEKIHQPAPGVTLFTLYGGGSKRFLFLKHGRKAPFLFLSRHKVAVGSAPPAEMMRLRKYLSDHRIVDSVVNWVERRLFLRVAADTERWLCLDLREGPSLLDHAPEPAAPVIWPDAGQWSEQCAGEGWRNWPVITPPLRRTLPLLPLEEQQALLQDLESGGGDLFLYENTDGERELFAWPLPPVLRQAREELVVDKAIDACAAAGETQVLRGMAAKARLEAAKPYQAEKARLERLLVKLGTERDRLGRMVAGQEQARLLQSQLYRFRPEEKQARVELESPNGSVTLELDPKLTIRENMAALFHQASRGKRGFVLLKQRFAAVEADLAQAERAALTAEAATSGVAAPQTSRNPVSTRLPALPKNVQPFRSSDGFLLLRGRDAKGNAQLLKLAAPHDLWMHTGGGPGAHILIRRDHAAQEIPAATLSEAGSLAVLKSWRKDETQVDVIAALAKYVHPIKGARPGTVRVDRYETSVVVTPDPDLETRLLL